MLRDTVAVLPLPHGTSFSLLDNSSAVPNDQVPKVATKHAVLIDRIMFVSFRMSSQLLKVAFHTSGVLPWLYLSYHFKIFIAVVKLGYVTCPSLLRSQYKQNHRFGKWYLFWSETKTGWYVFWLIFKTAYIQPYHLKGLGESFPLMGLSIGLHWKMTKIHTTPVLVSYQV